MVAPSLLSLLVILGIVQTVSGQGFRGPGYLACPFVDILSTTDSVYDCLTVGLDLVNCTSAQLDACRNATIDETTDASFQTYYVELPCGECAVAYGCPESCNLFSGDVPELPLVSGYVNYTDIGNVTCPLAYYFNITDPDDCFPLILDPTTCGTCNTTSYDEEPPYLPGDTTITFQLDCDCVTMINCPNTCTFVANDGVIEAPIAAPVAAPRAGTTTSPVLMPISDEAATPVSAPTSDQLNDTAPVSAPTSDQLNDTAPVSAPTSDQLNNTAPVSAPTSDKGNVTGPVSAPTKPVSTPSAPIRNPVAAPSSTSYATMTTSHKVCALTAVLTMMYVSAF